MICLFLEKDYFFKLICLCHGSTKLDQFRFNFVQGLDKERNKFAGKTVEFDKLIFEFAETNKKRYII